VYVPEAAFLGWCLGEQIEGRSHPWLAPIALDAYLRAFDAIMGVVTHGPDVSVFNDYEGAIGTARRMPSIIRDIKETYKEGAEERAAWKRLEKAQSPGIVETAREMYFNYMDEREALKRLKKEHSTDTADTAKGFYSGFVDEIAAHNRLKKEK
jgi:hypothetical protein